MAVAWFVGDGEQAVCKHMPANVCPRKDGGWLDWEGSLCDPRRVLNNWRDNGRWWRVLKIPVDVLEVREGPGKKFLVRGGQRKLEHCRRKRTNRFGSAACREVLHTGFRIPAGLQMPIWPFGCHNFELLRTFCLLFLVCNSIFFPE